MISKPHTPVYFFWPRLLFITTKATWNAVHSKNYSKCLSLWLIDTWFALVLKHTFPDSKVHGASMGPTWVLSAPDGPHVGPMNFAIWVHWRWVSCLNADEGTLEHLDKITEGSWCKQNKRNWWVYMVVVVGSFISNTIQECNRNKDILWISVNALDIAAFCQWLSVKP